MKNLLKKMKMEIKKEKRTNWGAGIFIYYDIIYIYYDVT